MTTLRLPADTEWVIDPVSRSPAGRDTVVSAGAGETVVSASASRADVGVAVGVDAAATRSVRSELMAKSGRVHPVSPAASVSATPSPARPLLVLRADMGHPPPAACAAFACGGDRWEGGRRRPPPAVITDGRTQEGRR